METTERTNDEKRASQTWPNFSCCMTGAGTQEVTDRSQSISGTFDCSSMMGKCAAMCRWLPLVPVILGTALLLVGYYLDASITRVLWMSAAGFVALMGVAGQILAGRMKKMSRGMV